MALDFGALPPEINSARIYAGPGSGPIMAAAAGWDGLASELGSAAAGYASVISELASDSWIGPASASMLAAAAPYVAWLSATAAHAEETASQARAAGAAYETAFAMTVPPPVVAANRILLMTLIATNFFGQNTPAIATTEAHYAEMWAQDATAMYGYAGSSATASQLPSFTPAPETTNPTGLAAQAATTSKAATTPAGISESTASSATPQLVSTTAVPQALQQLSANTSSTSQPSLWQWLEEWLVQNTIPVKQRNALNHTWGLVRRAIGYGTYFSQLTQPRGQSALGRVGAPGGLPGGAAPTWAGLSGGGSRAVSAGAGQAGRIGLLSVPPSWAAASEAHLGSAPTGGTSFNAASTSTSGGLLRGLPLTGAGHRHGGASYRYGTRQAVVARPPSGG